MTDKSDAEDNHPERQKVIVQGGEGRNNARHVAEHSNQSSDCRENSEVADPAREARPLRQHGEAGEKEEHAEAQFSDKLTDVVPEKAIQAREDGSDRRAISFGSRSIGLSERPMNARPPQQAEHHADRRNNGEEHRDTHAALAHLAERVEGADAGRNPDERQKAVDRPHRSTGRASGEKAWQNLRRAAVEHLRIVELSSEVREHAHKCERAADQEKSADPNWANAPHKAWPMDVLGKLGHLAQHPQGLCRRSHA